MFHLTLVGAFILWLAYCGGFDFILDYLGRPTNARASHAPINWKKVAIVAILAICAINLADTISFHHNHPHHHTTHDTSK